MLGLAGQVDQRTRKADHHLQCDLTGAHKPHHRCTASTGPEATTASRGPAQRRVLPSSALVIRDTFRECKGTAERQCCACLSRATGGAIRHDETRSFTGTLGHFLQPAAVLVHTLAATFQAGYASSIIVTRSITSPLVTAALTDSHAGGIESLTIV